MINKYRCPECKGSGESFKTDFIERTDINNPLNSWTECFFCEGTGYASDEPSFAEFYYADT